MGGRTSGRRPADVAPPLQLMPSKPLPPPKHASADVKRIFRATVASMPAGFFTASDVPLLYVHATALDLLIKASAKLETEGMVTRSLNGTVYPHPCVNIVRSMAATVAALSSKLRLSKSARTPPDVAATEVRRSRAASVKKPWEQ